MLTVILLLAAVTIQTGESQNVCPFNNNCTCDDSGKVDCDYSSSFPVFAPYNITWTDLTLTIAGKFTYIPPSALYPLIVDTSVTTRYSLYLYAPAFHPSQLTLYPESFRTTSMNFTTISLNFYKLLVIPPGVFSNLTIDLLTVSDSLIPYINDNAFVGLTVSQLTLSGNNVQYVSPLAFSGVKKVDELKLAMNQLTAVPEALKTVRVSVVDLRINQITQIFDYAFPATVTYLRLSFNPISFISDYAFANMTALTFLSLRGCNLTDVPVTPLRFVRKLTHLDLSSNLIKFIAANSFSNLHFLTELFFTYTPITRIDVGAFNGLSSITDFSLNRLPQLTQLDLVALSGMSNLTSFSMSHCPKLTNVHCSDWSKLPPNLHMIDFSQSMDVTSIDSELKLWFLHDIKNTFNISNNANFVCDDTLQWMAPFVCCFPYQINATETYCSGTYQPLIDYMKTFKPVCD